jgi:LysR family transcriptional regulator, nod-box dependent transcriptional activator
MRFNRLDLNLLVVLNALLRERSVTRAARELHLSQPAISASLARLRDYFNDELLIPHGKRMIPTAHAQNLAPLVAQALADIEMRIMGAAVFEPQSSKRCFRLCASDYICVVLLRPLVAELEKAAPGVRINISAPTQDTKLQLERGDIDFLLTPEQFASNEHPRQLLFEERYVAVGCRSNPLFQQELTAEQFFAHGQVVISDGHAPSLAAHAQCQLNRRPKIDVECASIISVPWMLPGTRRIAMMQERLAKLMVTMLPLSTAPLPFEFPLLREVVQYHSARVEDSGMRWLLGALHAQAKVIQMLSSH